MLEAIAGWDHSILHAVNGGWASPMADAFFRFITHEKNFFIPGAILLLFFWVRCGRKGRFLAVFFLLNILVTDQMSSGILKPLVQRPRPCQTLTDIRTPDGCGPAYSFPSSHAANSAGMMTILALAYPAWVWPAAAFAFLVGLSRVYLGVHYPSDVLCGFALGIFCAFQMWRLRVWTEYRWFPLRESRPQEPAPKRPMKKRK
jgi:undecaprenyl-diphosphatase